MMSSINPFRNPARRSLLLGGALAIFTMAIGCGDAKTIKIGYNGQMTGPDSYCGQSASLALADRIKEINDKGGIDGKKLELVIMDNRSEATEAVAVAKRLMEQEKVVGMIGPDWSGASIPLGPMAAAAKVPIVTTTASNVKVTVDDNGKVQPYMFRACFIDPYQGYVLAQFAYKELGKRKAACIYDVGGAYAKGIMEYFEKEFTRLGGAMVAKEGYQNNDTEFRAQISTVKKADPDVVLVPAATYRDIALIAKQTNALGLKFQFLGVDGWVTDDLLKMAGKELEGAYLSSGVSTASPEFKDFNEAFGKLHNNVQLTVHAYYSLDCMMMLEHAMKASIEKTKKIDPVVMRDELENMKDVQLFTSKMTMEPTTHNPHNKPAIIMAIKDSKWEIVKTYAPQD